MYKFRTVVQSFIFSILLITDDVFCILDHLELKMPHYALKGGSVSLRCEHNLTLEQVHKVEWQKGGNKIVQYIKGRQPPMIYYSTAGAIINKINSSYTEIVLSDLESSASGSYSCVVSMETPIFMKDSDSKYLTVIEAQETDPVITFNKDSYEIGETFLANCTSAIARPAPHLTWLINDQKVADKFTKSFPNDFLHSHPRYFDRKASSVKQLSIEVSKLHVLNGRNVMELTCMSTIPPKVGHNEGYADIRTTTLKIAIEFDNEANGVLSKNHHYNNDDNVSISNDTTFARDRNSAASVNRVVFTFCNIICLTFTVLLIFALHNNFQ